MTDAELAVNAKARGDRTQAETLPGPPAKAEKLLRGADVIRSLQTEHDYMSRMMAVLQNQVDRLEQGQRPDYSLMHATLHYLDSVSDTSHHPREDLLFNRLLTIDPHSKPLVEPLITAHEAIEQKTDNLLHSIQATLDNEVPLNVDQVRRQANDYLLHLRKHLSGEEAVYALIQQQFSEQDWQALLDQLQPVEDPVFGNALDERYGHLVAHLREDIQQRVEDYTLAEFLSLNTLFEMVGSVARNGGRLGGILKTGFRENFARDRATVKRLLQQENRSFSKGIGISLDCMLDDYDNWVTKLSEAGQVLRDARNEFGESYRSSAELYHDLAKHD